MLTLTLKHELTVPLEVEALSPDVIAPLSASGVSALPVFHGKRRLTLGDFFTLEGEPGEAITIRGDCQKVKWIGRGMTRGSIHIAGNAGMHTGAYMQGGCITISGNASDWIGGEMRGGHIHIRGNAGGQIAAAYRGSMSGMAGGSIFIEGTAGIELGMRMKRGLIAVRGKVKDFAGTQMKGGTIILMSGAELRTGAWMTRGTIVSYAPLKLMPTFAPACTYRPDFLALYAKSVQPWGLDLPLGMFQRYLGDTALPGKGEILIAQ